MASGGSKATKTRTPHSTVSARSTAAHASAAELGARAAAAQTASARAWARAPTADAAFFVAFFFFVGARAFCCGGSRMSWFSRGVTPHCFRRRSAFLFGRACLNERKMPASHLL